MNKYGEMARRRWEAMNPTSYAQIDNPDEFFSTMGAEIGDRVVDLQRELAGSDRPDEGYLEKVGRLNAARNQAEEFVLAEFLGVVEVEDDEDASDEPSDIDRAIWAIHRAGDPDDEQ